MGSVYLVRSPGGTPYALKLLDPEMAKSDPDFKVRFMREAEFAMTLHHRNLIPVLDAGEDPELGVYTHYDRKRHRPVRARGCEIHVATAEDAVEFGLMFRDVAIAAGYGRVKGLRTLLGGDGAS